MPLCVSDGQGLELLSEENRRAAWNVTFLTQDDPAVSVELADDDLVHAALSHASSPVPQQATAALSKAAFRQWLNDQAVAVKGGCLVQGSNLIFHLLTQQEAQTILTGRWQRLHWAAACNAGVIPSPATAFLLTPEGRGHATVFKVEQIFGLLLSHFVQFVLDRRGGKECRLNGERERTKEEPSSSWISSTPSPLASRSHQRHRSASSSRRSHHRHRFLPLVPLLDLVNIISPPLSFRLSSSSTQSRGFTPSLASRSSPASHPPSPPAR